MKEFEPKPKPTKPRLPSVPVEPLATVTLRNEELFTLHYRSLNLEIRRSYDKFLEHLKDIAKEHGYKITKDYYNRWCVKIESEEVSNPNYDQQMIQYVKDKEAYSEKLLKYNKRLVKYEQDLIKWKAHMKAYYQQQADLIEVDIVS
jgi:uncharacterized protein YbcC (UPF0753/DUF2309 family)